MTTTSLSDVQVTNDLPAHLPEDLRGLLVARDQPSFVEPMLATLTDKRFSDPERTSFGRLEQRLGLTDKETIRSRGVTVYYYLFDVLHLQGHDTTGLPLRQRKQLLKQALSFEDPLRYTPHRVGDGEAAYASPREVMRES